MAIGAAICCYGVFEAEEGDPEAQAAVEDCHYHEVSEPQEREVDCLLAWLVDDGVVEALSHMHILFQWVCEHARPRRPKCIVKHRQPVHEVNLPAKSIEKCESDFSEDEAYIFIEVVADEVGDSAVPPLAMH